MRGRDIMVAVPDVGVDFVLGPTGEVNLPAYRVWTHRLTASVPFGH